MTQDFYSGHQIKALTGLRGVGVVLVVLYHFHFAQAGPLRPFIKAGGTVALMLFFALSGYILALLYEKKFKPSAFLKDYKGFIWKRIARIYPLHIFLLVLALFFYPKLNIGYPNDTRQLFANLTLTQGWTFDSLSFIAASWSISVEFLFYLFFPFIVRFINRWAAVAVFLILGASYALLATDVIRLSPELIPYWEHRIVAYGTFFILGVSVFFMTQHRFVRLFLDNNFAFVFLCAIVVLMPRYKLLFFGYPFVIPLLVRSSYTSKIGNYLLGGTVILWIGELSYSIYLSHQFIYLLVANAGIGKPESYIYDMCSTYLLLIIWCIFCYNAIEVPIRGKLREIYNRELQAAKSL